MRNCRFRFIKLQVHYLLKMFQKASHTFSRKWLQLKRKNFTDIHWWLHHKAAAWYSAFSCGCCSVGAINQHSAYFIFVSWFSKIIHPLNGISLSGNDSSTWAVSFAWQVKADSKTPDFTLPPCCNSVALMPASHCLQVGFLRGGSSCAQQMLNYSVDLVVVSLRLWQANNSVSSSGGEPQQSRWHGRLLCGGSAAKTHLWSSAALMSGE